MKTIIIPMRNQQEENLHFQEDGRTQKTLLIEKDHKKQKMKL